jgi:hypothetical protein
MEYFGGEKCKAEEEWDELEVELEALDPVLVGRISDARGGLITAAFEVGIANSAAAVP